MSSPSKPTLAALTGSVLSTMLEMMGDPEQYVEARKRWWAYRRRLTEICTELLDPDLLEAELQKVYQTQEFLTFQDMRTEAGHRTPKYKSWKRSYQKIYMRNRRALPVLVTLLVKLSKEMTPC